MTKCKLTLLHIVVHCPSEDAGTEQNTTATFVRSIFSRSRRKTSGSDQRVEGSAKYHMFLPHWSKSLSQQLYRWLALRCRRAVARKLQKHRNWNTLIRLVFLFYFYFIYKGKFWSDDQISRFLEQDPFTVFTLSHPRLKTVVAQWIADWNVESSNSRATLLKQGS